MPSRCKTIYHNLEEWCESPLPKLETWILEVFELLAEYGLIGSTFSLWYRKWASYLLDTPIHKSRINLEVWLAFGNWMQPGVDIITRLQQALDTSLAKEGVSPVSALPENYQIGIFSLMEASAQRVREIVLKHNSHLDVRICTDKVLSKQAQAIAENSDMVVIVTASITHALTQGIEPYLKKAKRIYPSSSGSTSIMQAIEKHLWNESN
jgi:hypothetical protein